MDMRDDLGGALAVVLDHVPVLDAGDSAQGAGDDGEPFAEAAGGGALGGGRAAGVPVVGWLGVGGGGRRGGDGWGKEVGEFLVVVAGRDEDVAGGYGEDVEEGHDVRGGEDEVALGVDFLGIWRLRDWMVRVWGVGLGDFAERAGDGVVVVYGGHCNDREGGLEQIDIKVGEG